MHNMKLSHVYIPESMDKEIKSLAHQLSTSEHKITISDIIRAALASALNKFEHLDKDILKAYFELGIEIDVLTEMDPETIKSLLVLMK